MMQEGKTIEVLLVEDDPGDVELTLAVMKKSKLKINLSVVNDGEEAINYLYKKESFQDVKSPDLILLDLNLPRKDGREILKCIKQDKKMRLTPVVVLTTSEANEDIVRTYSYGANCFITKPIGLENFKRIVASIENFWFTVVKLPSMHVNS